MHKIRHHDYWPLILGGTTPYVTCMYYADRNGSLWWACTPFSLIKIKATMNNKIQKQKKILILLVIYSNIYLQPSEK